MDLPWAALAPGVAASGGWLLALYFMRLVYTGRLVHRSLYDKEAAAGDRWREAASQWRQAYEAERDQKRSLVVPMAQVLTSVNDAGDLP